MWPPERNLHPRLENVANLLGALATLVSDGVARAIADDPAAVTQRTALALVAKYPGCSIEQLRSPLALSHSGCVRLVDRLVERGALERRTAPDGRAVALTLTRAGRALAAASGDERMTTLLRLLSALTPQECKELGRLTSKLIGHAKVTERDAGTTCRLCNYSACVACPMRDKFTAG